MKKNTFQNMVIVFYNVLKMLKERGYHTSTYERITEEKLRELYPQQNFEIIVKPSSNPEINRNGITKNMHVRFSVHSSKPSSDDVESLVEDFGIEDINDELDVNIILIFSEIRKNKKTKTTKINHTQTSNKLREKVNKHIQIFTYNELSFNIIDHVLVPKHELITDVDEIEEIVEGYRLQSKWRLPHTKESDPVSKYYYARRGNLFRITKPSITAGKYIKYRVVV
jgi:DNA-directed RNA polymerase subunit H (RpoH/RPB5)